MSDFDPVDLSGQDKARTEKASRRKVETSLAITDFKWLMRTAQGRRFAQRLLERTGVFRSSFCPSGSEVFFREGQRNVGLVLLDEIQTHAPEALGQILLEKSENGGRNSNGG